MSERSAWDDLLGFCALRVKRSGVVQSTSFASFEHYAKGRLGLVPRTGCSRRATEGHHIWWRSRGGPDEPWNILPLCSFHHHRVVHGGFAEVTGRFPGSVEWVVKGRRWVDARFGRA